jgi:hypothetical protein
MPLNPLSLLWQSWLACQRCATYCVATCHVRCADTNKLCGVVSWTSAAGLRS